jgi:hypothetical protein
MPLPVTSPVPAPGVHRAAMRPRRPDPRGGRRPPCARRAAGRPSAGPTVSRETAFRSGPRNRTPQAMYRSPPPRPIAHMYSHVMMYSIAHYGINIPRYIRT